tara:strand:+ start:4889 stop:5179 length:291 start_codon:yes stop_codon:yes gene_type:complete
MRLNIIYQLVKEKGISFKKLSELVGKTDSGLRKSITRNSIDATELKIIAETFDVSLYYFFKDWKEDVIAPKKITLEDRLRNLEDSILKLNEIINAE